MLNTLTPQPTRARIVSLLWFPFFFAAAVAVMFMLAFSHPEPHNLRLGVVGEAPAALPPGIAVQSVTGPGAVSTNQVAGVYDSTADTLYVASAASSTRAEYLEKVLHPAHTVDLVPVAPGDVSGVSLFFYGLPLLLIGLITSIVLLQLGPWPTGKKVATIAATGAFASGVSYTVAVLREVLPSDPWLLLYGFLLTQAIGWFTTALARKLRQYFMPAAMTFVLVLGIPSSGATVNADMLPSLIGRLHEVLPFGQFIETVRASAYFDGHGLTRPLLTLLAWVAGAAALLAWASRPTQGATRRAQPVNDVIKQRLHGNVRTTAGAPVAGASVLTLDDSGRELVRTLTDAQGAYSIEEVEPGLHHLVVTAAHHEPAIVTIAVHAHRTELARDISVIDWNDPAGSLSAEEVGERRALAGH